MIRKLIALAAVLALTGGMAAAGAEGGQAAGEMTLLSVNVGKADAHLLCCGDDAYLIDTGTKESADRLFSVLRDNGITRLSGVILTHTHDDHTGSLNALLQSDIRVEKVYAPAFYNGKEKKHPAVKALKKYGREGQELIWLSAGDTLPFGDGTLCVLGPLEHNEEKENNNSLVLLASGGSGTLLLTGDMEFPEEESLLGAGVIPHVDVIKIGNHGEDDATSTELIRAASPSVAVISTNTADEPDTPSPRVIRLLEIWNVKVLQTQDAKDGVLVIFRDGEILTELK